MEKEKKEEIIKKELDEMMEIPRSEEISIGKVLKGIIDASQNGDEEPEEVILKDTSIPDETKKKLLKALENVKKMEKTVGEDKVEEMGKKVGKDGVTNKREDSRNKRINLDGYSSSNQRETTKETQQISNEQRGEGKENSR